MLIGNRERFAIELVAVEPSWERRYAPEAAAWAGLTIWVNGCNLCAHILEGEEELRTAFHVPLAPIADWLVRSFPALALEERAPWFPTSRRLHETVRAWGRSRSPIDIDEDAWLDVREAFWSRHFLSSGAEGAWLPNLAMLREDDEVVFAWAPPRFLSGPSLTMLHGEGVATAPWIEVATVLREFVDQVAQAFQASTARPYAWIDAAPRLVQSPEHGSPSALELFCGRSAAALGELFGVPSEVLDEILGAVAKVNPAASPACQVVRDLSPLPAPAVGAEVLSTVEASRHATSGASVAWKAGRELALDAARAGDTPEEQGQLAARTLRTELNLDGQPLPSTPDVLARYGVTLRGGLVSSKSERMLVAAAEKGGPVATVLRHVRTAAPWGCRFEEARALGHALLDPLRDGALGAASSRWAQETRRRRSGAFAAELLLPASAVEEASAGHLDGVYTAGTFGELLDKYQVGARAAAHQLYNHGFLSSRDLRDELIDEHAMQE